MKPETLEIEIDDAHAGERLDKALCDLLCETSRNAIQRMIKDSLVTVNKTARKANFRLCEGDLVEIVFPPAQEVEILPENIPLDILYEDSDLLVVNKPKGMVVHPAPGHTNGTLVNAVMYHCRDSLSGINGELRPGIVHRIDMNTTGSLIVCKNDRAHTDIARQIKDHSIRRIYEGIVIGNVKEDEGTVAGAIGRNPKDRKKMAMHVPGGKEAITHYRVLERFPDYTYMEFRLETGRTHQIRVHMAGIGHPLLGDDVYGPARCKFHLQGQTLHAKTIGFIHPTTGKYMEIDAPLPEYFEELLNTLRHLSGRL